jgi:hypothetical protein
VAERIAVLRLDGNEYRAVLRRARASDTREVVERWSPVFSRGPRGWLDREWPWEDLALEVAFDRSPETLVIADEIEEGCRRDIVGVVLTTGPHDPAAVGLAATEVGGSLLWLENIAIAPSLRVDCPDPDRREIVLKAVGVALMLAAIERSVALGCDGRIGLHAEGEVAKKAYLKWNMKELPAARHPAGGSYPVFFGSSSWADQFRRHFGGAR